MSGAHTVVLDVNVVVDAVTSGNSPFVVWPSPPPVSDNPAADCVGVLNDAREFALALSEHILSNTLRVLVEGYAFTEDEAGAYVEVLVEIAAASGGGVYVPTGAMSDCEDYEDNRILECALEADAALIVSSDHHLIDLSPWRGRPILTPREFAARVDAMRRAKRRG